MHNHNKGFTILEMLIALAVVGVIITMITIAIMFSISNFKLQSDEVNIQSNIVTAMECINRSIIKSSNIEIGGIDGTVIVTDNEVYRLEDGVLLRNNKKITSGIDELNIDRLDDEVNIEIAISDRKGRVHRLSSTINIR